MSDTEGSLLDEMSTMNYSGCILKNRSSSDDSSFYPEPEAENINIPVECLENYDLSNEDSFIILYGIAVNITKFLKDEQVAVCYKGTENANKTAWFYNQIAILKTVTLRNSHLFGVGLKDVRGQITTYDIPPKQQAAASSSPINQHDQSNTFQDCGDVVHHSVRKKSQKSICSVRSFIDNKKPKSTDAESHKSSVEINGTNHRKSSRIANRDDTFPCNRLERISRKLAYVMVPSTSNPGHNGQSKKRSASESGKNPRKRAKMGLDPKTKIPLSRSVLMKCTSPKNGNSRKVKSFTFGNNKDLSSADKHSHIGLKRKLYSPDSWMQSVNAGNLWNN